MSYISLADAKTLLGRILDIYENDADVVQDDHLQLVIDEAEAMINMSICSRYDIPATDADAVAFLRSLVVPILRFKSYTQFAESDDMPESIIVEYKSVMTTLDKLARQVISLPDTDDKTTGRASYIKATIPDTPSTGF